jgi:hypothetical protein
MSTRSSRTLALAGALAFSVQILADFSGYTDIARGTARMLGFELMQNFRHPYLAATPSEFWRRWHISFSSWIRDYLYIPLGGSRGSRARVARATWTSMLLSGLWHGASWTFVLWGAYHAAILTVYRWATPRVPAWARALPGARLAAIGVMFCLTCVGWLIFRETDPHRLIGIVAGGPVPDAGPQRIIAGMVAALALACAAPLILALWIEARIVPRARGRAWALPLETTLWAALSVCIFLFARESAHDFIYFRF